MTMFSPRDDTGAEHPALAAAWQDRRGRGLNPRPVLTPAGLVLGAGTLLAKRSANAWAPQALDVDAGRLLALLAIAYGGPHTAGRAGHILAKVEAAGRALAANEAVQAAIHLAHAGLGALPDTEATAHRLFLAETLLDDGMAPNALVKVAFSKIGVRINKYNHNHRLTSPGAGQFCSADDVGEGGTPIKPPRIFIPQNPNERGPEQRDAFKTYFVEDNLDAARQVAKDFNVPVENILGLAALESGWGGRNAGSRFASDGNNYFGQQAPAPYSTGHMLNQNGRVREATFATPADSFRSFAKQNGELIRSIVDPGAFATALQNSGRFGVNPDGSKVEGYVRQVAATINGLRGYVDAKNK